jgi:hypothetical protein
VKIKSINQNAKKERNPGALQNSGLTTHAGTIIIYPNHHKNLRSISQDNLAETIFDHAFQQWLLFASFLLHL